MCRYRRKSNNNPIAVSDVVCDRRGRRYYIESLSRNKLCVVSMCELRLRTSGPPERFGCYKPAASVEKHSAGMEKEYVR